MRPARKKRIGGTGVGFADEAHGMDADRQFFGSVPGPGTGFAIQVDERTKAFERAADNRDHERKAERTCTNKRFRRASDADPDRQPRLMWPGIDALKIKRGAETAFPFYVGRFPELEQQIKLLGKQVIVVPRGQTE